MNVKLKVSVGELFDKLTILNIKYSRIEDSEKIEKVKEEMKILEEKKEKILDKSQNKQKLIDLENKLKVVNTNLWKVEEKLRKFEEKEKFDDEFIQLARSVYKNNDKRFDLKDRINRLVDSDIKEVKSY